MSCFSQHDPVSRVSFSSLSFSSLSLTNYFSDADDGPLSDYLPLSLNFYLPLSLNFHLPLFPSSLKLHLQHHHCCNFSSSWTSWCNKLHYNWVTDSLYHYRLFLSLPLSFFLSLPLSPFSSLLSDSNFNAFFIKSIPFLTRFSPFSSLSHFYHHHPSHLDPFPLKAGSLSSQISIPFY